MSARMSSFVAVAGVVAGALCCVGVALATPYDHASLAKSKGGFPETEEAVASGAQIYRKHCAFCHGDEGKGDGGAAKYLEPRPRDFSKGIFKFRSTKSGELPTDEDLFRVISRGVPGTTMPAWGEGSFKLDERQRWEVAYFVKTLGGEDFQDDEFDPYREDAAVPLPEAPQTTPDRIEAGRALFTDAEKGGCVKCHGVAGRGNGEQAGAQRDDWGDAILAADLTKAWRYKAGTSPTEIFRTLSTGLSGTPMPGYAENLGEKERWDLAIFVRSLQFQPDLGGDRQLVAHRATGELPMDPWADRWLAISPLDVPLMGQVIYRPRHHNASVDLVQIRALYTDTDIAFHFTWNDRTQSVEHRGTQGGDPPLVETDSEIASVASIDDTFVPAATTWQRRELKLRDSLQLQFPARSGSSKPFFFLGGKGGAVNQWRWLADRESSGEGRAFEERNQNGPRKPGKVQADEDQALTGRAEFRDGQWALIISRPRNTDSAADAQFSEGEFIPFALQMWDGGNGEEGLLCSLSSWYYLRLETPTPAKAYLAGVVGFLAALVIIQLLVSFARRSSDVKET